jgi:hypothetical protein
MDLGHRFRIIKPNEDIREALADLTDEDFNGNNGEDYYSVIETEIGNMSISRLDYSFTKAKNEMIDPSKVDLIRRVLEDNYADAYYKDESIEIHEVDKSIFVSIAYMC